MSAVVMRDLYSIPGHVYGWLKFPKNITFDESFKAFATPFKAYAYLCSRFKYRKDEPSSMNCLSAEEVWSDRMLDPKTGKHWDDCDGYAIAIIKQLKSHGYKCRIVCLFTEDSGHATCVVDMPDQRLTVCTFGYWCHGDVDDHKVAQDFYKEPVLEMHVYDDEWNPIAFGEWEDGKFVLREVEP